MDGSGSGGGKLFGRFTEQAQRVLDLAQEEADRSATATSAPSMSCSGCSPRARAGPPGCCEPLGWILWRPGPRSLAWPVREWCRHRGPATLSC